MARVGPLAGRDIDALFNSLRPRIIGLGGGGGQVGPQGPAGPKGVVWRGAWAADQDYSEGDIVTDTTDPGGSPLTYFCLQDHTSLVATRPTVGGDTNWHEINAGYLFTDGSRPYVLAPGHTPTEGTLHWDTSSGIDRLVMDVSGAAGLVQTPIGGVVIRVLNSSGAAIPAGKGVAIDSASGNTLTVLAANSGMLINDDVVFGVSLQTMADGEEGWICCHGYAGGLNLSAFAAGAQLYLDLADGDLTATAPYKGCAQRIRIGVVIDAANPGTLWVQPDHRPLLDELSNVSIGDYSGAGPDWDAPGAGRQYCDVPMWLPDPRSEWCDAWRDSPANRLPTRTVDANYSLTVKDSIIFVDDSAGSVTVTLPPSNSSAYQNIRVTINKITGGEYITTIAANGADTIGGEASIVLVALWESVTLQNDAGAATWRVM